MPIKEVFESERTLLPVEEARFDRYLPGQESPNPFTGATRIGFALPEDAHARKMRVIRG